MTIIKIFKRGWWPHHSWHPFKGKDKCYTCATVEHPDRMTAMKRATDLCQEKNEGLTAREREADVKYEWTFIQKGD